MNAKFGLWTVMLATLITAAAGAEVIVKKERGGYTVRSSERYDVSPGGELKMDDLFGDIQITGGSYAQAEVIQEYFFDVSSEAEARDAFEQYGAAVKKLGNRLIISGSDKLAPRPSLNLRIIRLNVGGRDFGASYQVFVPQEFNVDAATSGGDVELTTIKGRVDLETSGGDLEIANVSGNLDGQTSGGDVSARNTEGPVNLGTAGGDVSLIEGRQGPYVLKTSGGDITVQSLKGQVRASTAGGDIEAREVEGDLDLRTSGGDITLEDVKGAEHRASTSGGDVEARGVQGNVDLQTSGGMILANRVQGTVMGSTSGGDMEITEITGDADISTSGGDLFLRDVRGRLVGETSGGDITARVEKGGRLSGPIRLSTSGGEIELRLPADAQASVSALIRIQDSWENYTVRSDFKLKIEDESVEGGRRGRHVEEVRATGDINGGGPLIELETVNGDISIVKGN